MKVIVFGATGQIGRHVTQRALDVRHEVTAFARNPQTLDITDEALSLHAGDAYDPRQVADAIAGHDAAIITLGTGRSRKNTLRSVGTRNVITAMHQHGVKRLVCQTTLGCQETWGQLNFYWKRIMFGAVLRPIFNDHEEQERLTQASGLDWTIVRPSAFTDEPGNGELLIGFPPTASGLRFTVAKRELASCLVDQVDDRTHIGEALSISR